MKTENEIRAEQGTLPKAEIGEVRSFGKKVYKKSQKGWQSLQQEVIDYFEFCEIEVSPVFSLEDFCNQTGLASQTAHVLLCNMEHEEIQELIANGQYDQFDMYDSSQFNDSYHDVMEQLGLGDLDGDE